MLRLPYRIGLLLFVLALVVAACAVPALVSTPEGHAGALPAVASSTAHAAAKVGPRARRMERASPLGARAIRVARRYIGVPYRWGGASPSGFDCSGLVMYAYGKLGVPLPHNAAALFGVGRPVSLARLRPGDLVFFSGLGHVGMAVGGGRYIHSPQSGRSVEIDSLAARSGSIVGARRILAGHARR